MPKLKLDNAGSLANIQEPPMLISEILPEGSITCVYAPTYSGKTFFALAAAEAVAGFNDFMGHFKVPDPGNVIFIEQDSPEYDTGRALYAMLKPKIESLKAQTDGSYHLNALGISWHPMLDLQKAEDCSTIAETARTRYTSLGHHGPVERAYIGTKLIILDTLRRLHGADENDATKMDNIMGRIQWIRENGRIPDEPKPAILFLHHSTKAGFTARGSSAIEATVDNIFRISRNKRTGIITCHIEKARAIQPPSFRYRIITEDHKIHGTLKRVEFVSLVEDPNEPDAPPSTTIHQLLQYVTNSDTPYPRADLHEWGALNDVPKTTINKWIRDLKAEGKVKVRNGCISIT